MPQGCVCLPNGERTCLDRRSVPGSNAFVPAAMGLAIGAEVAKRPGGTIVPTTHTTRRRSLENSSHRPHVIQALAIIARHHRTKNSSTSAADRRCSKPLGSFSLLSWASSSIWLRTTRSRKQSNLPPRVQKQTAQPLPAPKPKPLRHHRKPEGSSAARSPKEELETTAPAAKEATCYRSVRSVLP